MGIFMSFSARLKEERKRLKITQKKLAEAVGITEQAQVSYEKGRQPQFSGYLEALAREGLDVAYILTGERGGYTFVYQGTGAGIAK